MTGKKPDSGDTMTMDSGNIEAAWKVEPREANLGEGGEKAMNPLELIETDLTRLMRANARLADQLEKERDRAAKTMKNLLLNLLQVLDGFDALFRNLREREETLEQQTKILASNFRAVRRKLSLALERVGVVLMEVPLGIPADPFLHEIAETRKAPGMADGTILEVIQTGYYWNDEVLRYASVVTAKNSEEGKHG